MAGERARNVTLAVGFPGDPRPLVLDPVAPVSEAVIASGASVHVVDHDGPGSGEEVRGVIRVIEGPDWGREFQVRSGQSIIGRDVSADIRLSDPLVSKRHARVEFTTAADIVDLNSANGHSPCRALRGGRRYHLGSRLGRGRAHLQLRDAPA